MQKAVCHCRRSAGGQQCCCFTVLPIAAEKCAMSLCPRAGRLPPLSMALPSPCLWPRSFSSCHNLCSSVALPSVFHSYGMYCSSRNSETNSLLGQRVIQKYLTILILYLVAFTQNTMWVAGSFVILWGAWFAVAGFVVLLFNKMFY